MYIITITDGWYLGGPNAREEFSRTNVSSEARRFETIDQAQRAARIFDTWKIYHCVSPHFFTLVDKSE
jgi:hypothetical protein